jgi:hypothetical protein
MQIYISFRSATLVRRSEGVEKKYRLAYTSAIDMIFETSPVGESTTNAQRLMLMADYDLSASAAGRLQ